MSGLEMPKGAIAQLRARGWTLAKRFTGPTNPEKMRRMHAYCEAFHQAARSTIILECVDGDEVWIRGGDLAPPAPSL